jgi:hypothetical protein
MNIADSRCSSRGQQGALGEQRTLLSFTLVVIVLVTLGKASDQQHVCHCGPSPSSLGVVLFDSRPAGLLQHVVPHFNKASTPGHATPRHATLA